MSMTQPVSASPASGPKEVERSPFARLAELLAGHEPGKPLISLSLGEPQHPVPDFVGPVLAKYTADFGRYPIAKGIEPFRKAAADWCGRRFKLPRAAGPGERGAGAERQPRGPVLRAPSRPSAMSARGAASRRSWCRTRSIRSMAPAPASAGCETVSAVDRSGERLPSRSRQAERRPARAHGRLLHRLAREPARLGRKPRLFRQAEGARGPPRLHDLQRRALFGDLHE